MAISVTQIGVTVKIEISDFIESDLPLLTSVYNLLLEQLSKDKPAEELKKIIFPPIENVSMDDQLEVSTPTITDENISPISNSELDTEGLPWDNRIHSSKKSKSADGHWRLMRNVTPETVEIVKNELRATVKSIAIPPPPIENTQAVQFSQLVNRVTAALHTNKLTPGQLADICKSAGIPALPSAANRPELMSILDVKLTALIGE